MTDQTQGQAARHRMVMALLGGAMGVGLWLLGRQWQNPALAPAPFVALMVWAASYAFAALALARPGRVARAIRVALVPATVVALLISLAARRYQNPTDVLDDPALLGAAALVLLLVLPFMMVWLQDRARVLHYADLFDAAWAMTVRYAAAWLFLALFWLLAFLGDTLLDLVGIDVIGLVSGQAWARALLSGAVLGLGLSVVHELRATISPALILRLPRLLLVPVLALVVVFLAAVPIRGLTQLFGAFSAAGVLSGTALVVVALISFALDRDDAAAVHSRGQRLATRSLALLLPLLSILAVWAIALRVQDYGWTPDRLLAATVAGFLLLYGLSYCLAALGGGWMVRIRHANVALALVAIFGAGLWLTPVLDVYRLSTDSQIRRFDDGRVTPEKLPLWQMAHDWGRAGQAGLMQLESTTEQPAVLSRIQEAWNHDNRFQFEQAVQRSFAPARVRDLLAVMPLRPHGTALRPGFLSTAPAYRLDRWIAGCARQLPEGQPGCVLVQAAFAPSAPARDQGLLLYLDHDGHARADHLVLEGDGTLAVRDAFDLATQRWPTLPASALSQVLAGEFRTGPSGEQALFLGDMVLTPGR